MNESIINFADVEDDILNYEVADEAVEAAAGILEGQAKNATIAFVQVWIPAHPDCGERREAAEAFTLAQYSYAKVFFRWCWG
jgi:hypothetical protein